ncbi:hypothetical protein L6164_037464 [Bauhinia variegata]|uniref:Uncharacterized protein n=1 Tax=Bauhinia variegata TaxID=167791 RepID=A0ACB9KK61_BAUVA|nr:hypothetical protein L6164_037464 [Bauhinia variegata]
MANVSDNSPMAAIQSEPPKTAVLVLEQNPNVDGATADVVEVDAVGNELAIVPVSETNGSEQVQIGQKRRGRPKKYDGDGNIVSFENFAKKRRGRPRGSGRLQTLASIGGFSAETAARSFIPYVLTIATGEDVVSRIVSFSHQRATHSVSMISATGAVSSVGIALSSGVTLNYEGRFEILYFSGSFTYGGIGGAHYRKGTLSVSLAKPDGNVFGGCLQGPMIAATPIQLVVASFKQYLVKQIRRKCVGEGSTTREQQAVNPDATTRPNGSEGEAEIVEDGQTWASPTSGLMPTTRTAINGVADDDVTPASLNQNMHPPADTLNGAALEILDGNPLNPISIDH